MSSARPNKRAAFKPLAMVFLLAAVLVVLASGASPAESAFPGANGKIAFMSTRDGDLEIYVMNANGSGQIRPTNNAADDIDPDWQPPLDQDGDGILPPADLCPDLYGPPADGCPPPGEPAVGGVAGLAQVVATSEVDEMDSQGGFPQPLIDDARALIAAADAQHVLAKGAGGTTQQLLDALDK